MLKKRTFIPMILIAVLVGLTFTSTPGYALSEYEKVQQELKRVQQEAARKAREQREAERMLSKLQQEKNQTLRDLNRINADLEQNSLEMMELESQILDTENALMDANEQLAAVNKRIEERDELIRDRLRLMYKKGEVKYLEVLMNSTSFSDFLDRMHYLNIIVKQDQKILEEQKADKLVKEEKQQEIAAHLAMLEGMYAELEKKRLELEELRRQREVQIASIQSQEEHYEHISEEAERLVMELAAKEAELNKKAQALRAKAGKLVYPLPKKYRVSSKFGPRVDPITGRKGAHHSGMDIAAPGGTDILAGGDGVVLAAQWVNGYGNYVIIDHGDNEKGQSVWTLYAHMSKISTKKGAKVKAGEKIGEVGSTGRSTGNHLHFEVRINQVAVDPAPYIN